MIERLAAPLAFVTISWAIAVALDLLYGVEIKAIYWFLGVLGGYAAGILQADS